MLSGPRRRIALGVLLLAIASVWLTVAGGRWLLLETRRHVVVRISNVDGIEHVFINCHLVASVETGESARTVDLGWLEPDDRIFISTTSIDSTPAWRFTGTSNGGFLFSAHRGSTESAEFRTTAHAVVFAEAFTAGGAELGPIGCHPPKAPAVEEFEAEGYAWSPDDQKVARVADTRSSYRQPNDFYDRVDAAGGWSLIALAVLGAIAAALTPSIRRFFWAHKGSLAGAGLALLGVAFIESVLPTILTIGGILLLFWAAFLLIGTGIVRTKCGDSTAVADNRRAS